MENLDEKSFDLEVQYQLYLKRVAFNENNMHPEQKKQLRQTFFGACGQIAILFRDGVGSLEEDEAIKAYQSILNQVGDFFMKLKGGLN